jgi:hypothetical protein
MSQCFYRTRIAPDLDEITTEPLDPEPLKRPCADLSSPFFVIEIDSGATIAPSSDRSFSVAPDAGGSFTVTAP